MAGQTRVISRHTTKGTAVVLAWDGDGVYSDPGDFATAYRAATQMDDFLRGKPRPLQLASSPPPRRAVSVS